ncbi:MAG: HD domain-containing phosphohydrolase [Candidatus Omnitrophota bacterium]
MPDSKKIKTPSKKVINGLVNVIGAGLSLVDRKMRIVWANSCQTDWFGGNGKTIGCHCYEVYQKRKKVCPRCPTKKVFETGKMQRAIQPGFTTKNEKRTYLLTVVPVKNGGGKVSQALELVQDITESKSEESRRIRLINKLKNMCSNLLRANRILQVDINDLKRISTNVKKLNSRLEERCKNLYKEFGFAKRELDDVAKISQNISSCSNLKNTLCLIVKLTAKIMNADACALRLISIDGKNLIPEYSTGLGKNYLNETPLKVGEGIAGKVAQLGKPLSVFDVTKDSRTRYGGFASKVGVVSALSVPTIFKEDVLGVITVYSKTPRHFNENEIKLIMTFANQAAVAIHEAQLYRDVHINYFNTIHSLVLAMEARDPYNRGHSERVTQYAIKIATKLRIPQEQIDVLQFGGRVHDVGKIGISDLILNKPGRLTLAERAIIELHPLKGAEMLEPLKFLEPCLPLVKHHHERFDGNGYPDRLKKAEIPLCARIVSCADAFDAMTSERPYRIRKLTLGEAIEELKLNSGKQFDPAIIPALINILQTES